MFFIAAILVTHGIVYIFMLYVVHNIVILPSAIFTPIDLIPRHSACLVSGITDICRWFVGEPPKNVFVVNDDYDAALSLYWMERNLLAASKQPPAGW